jgi:hypothetical protein
MAREIDDVYKRKQYKEEQYGGKKSYTDDYTGERIFRGNDADAIHKHPTNKTSDTDHITPIKVVEERYKGLSKEQQKNLVNNEKYNYATTNSQLNRSKGNLENHEYLARQLKKGEPENLKTSVKMLEKEASSRINMDIEATGMYAQNMTSEVKKTANDLTAKSMQVAKESGNSFVTGAKDTLVQSAIPLTAEAVRHLIQVAQGKESMDEAAKKMGEETVDIAVVGGTNRVLVDSATSILSNSENTVLKEIANSNEAAQIIAVAVIVQQSAVKYINGEIDEGQFIAEVGEKGAVMTAGMIGGQVGREIGGIIGAAVGTVTLPVVGSVGGYVAGEVIGEILGTIITTVACSAIVSVYNSLKHLNDYKLKEKQIRHLEQAAITEITNQRNKFKEIVEREYKHWDEEIQAGFDMMLRNACEQTYNLQGVTDGLEKILAVFGKEVAFKSIRDYEEQLNKPLKLKY